MNIRILAAGLIALAVFAPAANAKVMHRHHHHEKRDHGNDHGFFLGFPPEACMTINGYNVNRWWTRDCPATDMPYRDSYARDGFSMDSFGPEWGGRWNQ